MTLNTLSNLRSFVLLTAVALLTGTGMQAQDFNGYALYNASGSNTAYLIDAEGDIAHTWSCPTSANYACALHTDGSLVRGAVYENNQIDGAAIGGMVQSLDADGDVIWEFIYSSATYVHHHDLCLMPNGNVLLTAWEEIAIEDLEDMGYDDDGDKLATHIIEVQPNGEGGADIVWEWHIVDHFVQDEDDALPNYGVISEHPERLNINISLDGGGGGWGGGPTDWFHANGVDYNEDLDQIVFSSRYMSEIFVIDHSTTSEEAATSEGGNSGMGGDFLYRWGNPGNYGMSGSQIITAACHDARWVPNDGRPEGGYLMVFNNSGNSGNSAIDAIDAPVNGYTYDWTPGEAFQPTSYSWRHECVASASGQSAAYRPSNGNVFVNLSGGMGGAGYMYEVDQDDNMVFQYNAGTQKAFRYECDHAGIQALLEEPCELSVNEVGTLNFTIFPNPSTGNIRFAGEFGQAGVELVQVRSLTGALLLEGQRVLEMDLSSLPGGMYLVTAQDHGRTVTRKITLQ